MNRLVIIGNGFDLAHGLPTSYKDFIDDLWSKIIEKSEDYEELVFLNNRDFNITPIKKNCNFQSLVKNIEYYCDHRRTNYQQLTWNIETLTFYVIKTGSLDPEQILYFKNDFFKTITSEHIQNWVDIENLYYKELKKIVRYKGNNVLKQEDFWVKERKSKAKKLNNEFEQIKNLLEKYLNEEVVERYDFNIDFYEVFKFHNIFSPDIFDIIKTASWTEDFSKEDKDYIDELIKEENHGKVKLRFLNFNYTPTIYSYFSIYPELYKDSVYFAHGELDKSNNKINFGFGDEMDDDYKMIENINDNEYLKNFKSFQYLQNDTYKKLLDFVESERFEVFIMGSSCGLSDRTLLNTIFEHENCRSIKVFYYQKKDGTDNFTELTQNISRHFNDKKLMRSKIVRKKPEHKMPTIQLPKKV